MPSSDPMQSRLLQDVLDLSATDAAFRRALLDGPAEAIHARFGVRLPTGYRVRFIERGPQLDALFVLPDLRRDGDELDDDELEQAAGGTGGGTTPPVTWETPVDAPRGQP